MSNTTRIPDRWSGSINKLHLRINYGCDDRFKMVSRTIRVSAPYFGNIRIVNLGPDKNTEKFIPLLKEFPNVRVSNMGKYYHALITEDFLRSHYADVPDGEWCAWLDSDWRFPQYFLDNMQNCIEICEHEKMNHIFSYQLAHFPTQLINPDGIPMPFTQKHLDERIAKWKENDQEYGWPVFQKVEKKNLWTDGFLGNHSYALHVPYNKRIFPDMYYVHCRDFSDHGYCSTMIHQSWWYLGHNVMTKEEQAAVYNSWEYNMMENFKLKHHCYNSNHFHAMKEDPSFCEKLRELFLQFKDSKLLACQQMYRMATQYGMVFINVDQDDLKCDGVCCQYKCGRVSDIPV